MNKRVWVACLAVALVMSGSLARLAEAGYSSGKSSVSRSSSSRSSSASRRSSSHASSSSHSSSSSSKRSSSSYSSGKGQSYSSGKATSYRQSSYSGSGSFGSAAASARREQSSGASHSYSSGTPGQSGYVRIAPAADPRDRQIADLRSRLNQETYASRRLRFQQFYAPYYGRQTVSYHDHYSPWFWLWLMDRPNSQATWMYNHRYAMDSARYDALVAQNAGLRSRIADLERQNLPRDPTYVPPELPSPDLMYADTAATAATQPAPVQQAESSDEFQTAYAGAYSQPMPSSFQQHSASSAGGIFGGFFCVLVGIGGITTILWLLGKARHAMSAPAYWPPPLPASDRRPPPLPAAIAPPNDNPLNLRIGGQFSLDFPDYAGLAFTVEQILQYSTDVAGRQFRYTAYWAIARPPGEEKLALQLRVERLAGGGLAVLALRLHDQFEYSREFHDIVAVDGTGLFQITDDNTGQVTAEYRRVQGVLDSYRATASPLNRQAQAGAPRQIEYWDYSRQADSPDGGFCEYLIVEKEDSGWFRILVGPEIQAQAVLTC